VTVVARVGGVTPNAVHTYAGVMTFMLHVAVLRTILHNLLHRERLIIASYNAT
jgi:hypothetical protein